MEASNLAKCQIEKCPKQYAASMKAQLDARNYMYRLVLDMIAGKITPEQLRDETHAFVEKASKRKVSYEMMACNLKHCKQQLHDAMKIIDEKAGVTFDPSSIKGVRGHLKHATEAALKILDDTYKKFDANRKK